MGKDEFVSSLAAVFAWVNYAHPFREGNGRTTKVFLSHIAGKSPYALDFAAINPQQWNVRSSLTSPDLGSVTPEPEMMIPVFHETSFPRAERGL